MYRYLIVFAMLWSACGDSSPKGQSPTDTPTSGKISIAADETLLPSAKAEVSAFETICPKAKIKVQASGEQAAFDLLMKDSARVILVTRKPTADEEQFFQRKKMKLRVSTIARDGVALITHLDNPDTISYEFVMGLVKGTIKTWRDWSPKLKENPLQLVFDNASSSTVRYMTTLTGGTLGKNVYALGDNQKVIDYIKSHPNAIGIIGLNWISDGRDQTTGSFYEGFRVMAINPADTSKNRGTYFKPFQAYLLYEAYPFFRNVYAINGEPRDGLGTGFVSHLCSQKGQIVLQQGGLLPMSQKAWIREIEIKKSNSIP